MKALFRLMAREALQEMILILLVSGSAGVLGGLIVPMILYAAQAVAAGQRWPAGYLLLLGVLTVLLLITKGLSQHWTTTLAEHTAAKLLRQFTATLRQAELLDLQSMPRVDILLMLAYARSITEALLKAVNVGQLLLAMMVSWLYLVVFSAPAAFLILLGYVLDLCVYKVFRLLTRDAIQAETLKEQALFTCFQQVLDGFKELKSTPAKSTALFDDYLKPLIAENQALRINTAFYFSQYHLFTDICGYVVMAIIILLLPIFGLQQFVATIFAITIYQGKLLLEMLAQIPDIIKGQVAFTRFQQVTTQLQPRQPVRVQRTSKPPLSFQTLRLDQIQFTYPGLDAQPGFTIGPLNLTIRVGELLFIIGGNGSGKTTLLHVLTGLYRPVSGCFRLDERVIKMIDYRHLFAAVFAEVHLFDRLYGIPQPDAARVQRYLQEMELAHQIQYVDGRFSTLKLSMGQQKRLALVAALLEDRPIYVFDEWAADQAPDFRRYFYHQILPDLQARGKTVLVVSHDDRYFNVADRVIKLEYGQISEHPRHTAHV